MNFALDSITMYLQGWICNKFGHKIRDIRPCTVVRLLFFKFFTLNVSVYNSFQGRGAVVGSLKKVFYKAGWDDSASFRHET